MSLSLNTPSSPHTPPSAPPRADTPRPQYIELKANVHRKLLNRLNLEALASVERSRAEAEIRTLLFDLIAEEGMPLSMTERDAILGDVIDEVFGLGPLEPLLRDPTISDILVNTLQAGLRRAQRQARTAADVTFHDDEHLLRDHRPHRRARRPARRRQLADGRRPPAGRLARQRDHPAAGASTARCSRSAGFRPSRSRLEDLVAIAVADAADARVPRGTASRPGSTS